MKKVTKSLVKAQLVLWTVYAVTGIAATEQERLDAIRNQTGSLRSQKSIEDENLEKLAKEVGKIKDAQTELTGREKWSKEIQETDKKIQATKEKRNKALKEREVKISDLDKALKGLTPQAGQSLGAIDSNVKSNFQFDVCRVSADEYKGDIQAMDQLIASSKADLSNLSKDEKQKLKVLQEKEENQAFAKLLANATAEDASITQKVAKLAEEFSDPAILIEAIRKDKELLKNKAFQKRVERIQELQKTFELTRKLEENDEALSEIASEKSQLALNQGNSALDKFKNVIFQAMNACTSAKKKLKTAGKQTVQGMKIKNSTGEVVYDIEGEQRRYKNALESMTCDASQALSKLEEVRGRLSQSAANVAAENKNPTRFRTKLLETHVSVPQGLVEVSALLRDTLNQDCSNAAVALKDIEADSERQELIAAGRGKTSSSAGSLASTVGSTPRPNGVGAKAPGLTSAVPAINH